METNFDPSQYLREEPGYYVLAKTLTGNQYVPDETVEINGESDFLVVGLCGTQTGTYKLNWRTGQGKAIANQLISNANLVGRGEFPIRLVKPVIVPARGRLGVDLQDTSGSSNAVELVFVGIKFFRQQRTN